MIRLDRSSLVEKRALVNARAALAATADDAAGKAFVAARSRTSYTCMQPRLTAEQYAKCGYCEDYLRSRMIEVDHVRPQAPDRYWWLAYHLENLVAACRSCNNAKSKKWALLPGATPLAPRQEPWTTSERAMLVDPTVDDPSTHLTYVYAGYLWRIAGVTPRGVWTIGALELDRESLLRESNEFILDVMDRPALEVSAAKRALDLPRLQQAVADIAAFDRVERKWTQLIRIIIAAAVNGSYATPVLP